MYIYNYIYIWDISKNQKMGVTIHGISTPPLKDDAETYDLRVSYSTTNTGGFQDAKWLSRTLLGSFGEVLASKMRRYLHLSPQFTNKLVHMFE